MLAWKYNVQKILLHLSDIRYHFEMRVVHLENRMDWTYFIVYIWTYTMYTKGSNKSSDSLIKGVLNLYQPIDTIVSRLYD